MVSSGIFSPEAIKTRLQSYDAILWGENAENVDFVHVTVKILSGRDLQIRQNLASELFTILKTELPDIGKLSVDIHEMDKQVYCK